MISIASIVEGEGEVEALPVLLRRLHEWRPGPAYPNPLHPIRVKRNRFLNREDEFRRMLLLAEKQCGENGWLLILLDADDDCPVSLAADIAKRAKEYIPHVRLSVVLAKREYEAWFIAAARSLDGIRGFHCPNELGTDPESKRDAKGWISTHMSSRSYGEVLDQSAFSARFDFQLAFDNSRSFRKLCKEWQVNITHMDGD